MNTYTKILFTTLPLVFFFLIATAGTTYYFSRSALLDLGETWLDTRLSMAIDVVKDHDTILHTYGLDTIAASVAKAKLDAISQIRDIRVGKMGYIFAVNQAGIIKFHPNKYLMDTDISQEVWFGDMTESGGRLVADIEGEPCLARFAFFSPWNWYILAVDPMEEVYGVSNRMKPSLYALLVCAAVIISLALICLTRRLTHPLKQLVRGAGDIGKGNLSTRISIGSNDEFNQLAKAFNHMAYRLQETLTALQYSEEHFRALIENANDLIWILDAKGTFAYVSPSTRRILGYDPEELMGQNAFDFVHPEDRKALAHRFEMRVKSLITAQPIAHRFRHREEYWCTLETISKNLLDHPAISGMVINSRNITKRKMAEEALQRSHQELEDRVEERTRKLRLLNKTLNNEIQIRSEKEKELERANQAKSKFLANVSHEIRTPLNSVIGFGQLLATMIRDKQQAEYLSAITTAGKNLLELINDILDLSKMEADKLKIRKVPVSLEHLFNEIFHLFKVKLRNKDLDFSIHIDAGVPAALLLDKMRLRQVITNLVDNAVKFTPTGAITLEAKAGPSQKDSKIRMDLEIRVRDTGVGIPEDKIEVVFESFQQESQGTGREFGGTGLGLAICRQLTELMGGKISLASRPDQGSTFTLHLPGVEISQTEVPARPEQTLNLNAVRFSRETVLVVDDHNGIRFMLREILEKVNLDVIEAEDGHQAVETAREQMPRLIFMDAKMPLLDGIEAADRLKEDPATRHIPVCLMTASIQKSVQQEVSGKFAWALTKPIIIQDLMQVLDRFLSPADPVREVPAPALTDLDLTAFPGLGPRLAQDILPHLPEPEQAMKITDVQKISQSLQSLGTRFNCPKLEAFGTDLGLQADTFDIEQMEFSLKTLKDLMAGPEEGPLRGQ